MTFSESFVRELKHELARLELERAALDARINLLRQILAPEVAPQPSLLNGTQPNTPSERPTTFKGTVLGIIKDMPGVPTPKITRVIRERGLEPGGNTDLGHRVYNEIWRMKRTGEVREENGGWVAVQP